VLAESARLFGGEDAGGKSGTPDELNASDALTMAEFEDEIRRQILEELKGGDNADDTDDTDEAEDA
jgi:hypothetical protein